MESFQSIQRESGILGFFGLAVAFISSLLFMMLGAAGIDNPEGVRVLPLLFGLVGLAVFIIFIRGAWIAVGRPRHIIFSIDENEVEYGILGHQNKIAISDIRHFYWDDTDNFNFSITCKDGEKHRILYIETSVPHKRRPQLLAYLRSAHPDIPIRGCFHPGTVKPI